MTIGKSFIISLMTFIGLNVAFFILYYLLNGTLVDRFSQITSNPYIIFELVGWAMFKAISLTLGPSSPFLSIVALSFSPISNLITFFLNLLYLLGLIIPPLIASIVAGVLVFDRKEGAISWFLTSIIMAFIAFFGLLLSSSFTIEYLILLLIVTTVIGLMFTIFYGFFTLITRKAFPY
ncbi:MAG: hypothetical protein P8Y70_11300 [Candidatus Lokiarchaeota archaeon]